MGHHTALSRASMGMLVAVTVWMTPPAAIATTGGTKGVGVDVAPKEGLEDGQRVTVASRGFRPGQRVGVQQCPSPPGPNTEPPYTAQDCDPKADSSTGASDYREGQADGNGSFTTEFVVHSKIRAAAGSAPIDCARQQCAVVAFLADGGDEYGYDDISFRT